MAKKRKKDRRKGKRVLQFMAPIPGAVQTQIEELLEHEQPEKAMGIIDEWLEKRPDHPMLCFYAGCAYALQEEFDRAVIYFRKARRQDRRNESILYNLIPVYLQLGFPSHALRILKRYLRAGMAYDRDDSDHLADLCATLEQQEVEAADFFQVDLGQYEEANYWNEETQIAQLEGDWDAAIAAADKALNVLPDHPPALNNRAMSFYFVGRLKEAIADEERVLVIDPKNVHALSNLTRFYYFGDEREKMRDCFTRIQTLSPADWADQSVPIPKMLEAYAVAGTDEEIFAFLKQHAKEALTRGYYMLGAAAANLGQPREARRAWRKVQDDGSGWKQMAEKALDALNAGKTGLGRAPRFPYTAVQEFVARQQFEQLLEAVQEAKGDEESQHRAVEGMVVQHPGLLEAARWFLWHSDDVSPALHMLVLLGTEKAWAELRTFALGQAGTDKERMEAAQLLSEKGRLPADQPIRLWLRGEWKEILLKRLEITEEPAEIPYSEEVLKLLAQAGQAHQDKDLDEAERIYRRILEVEPNCLPAYNNLGQIFGQRGDMDAMRAYLEKSLEIDPDYAMGRCNLARIYLRDGQVDRAEELIKPLAERSQFAVFEIRNYQLVSALIHIERGDTETAESILDVLQGLYPDDPEVKDLADRLSLLQSMGDLFKWIRENMRRKHEREDARPLDEGASLETCLNRNTRDALQGMAQRLGMSGVSGYRKADLVNAVAARLREADVLRQVLSELPGRAREALDYLLEQDGVVSWDAFSERYGNDLGERYFGGYGENHTPMGKLRVVGLLYTGTQAGERRVQIPAELRPRLRELHEEA